MPPPLVAEMPGYSDQVTQRPVPSRPNKLDRSLLVSGLLNMLLSRHIIQCRHHRIFPAQRRPSCQAEITV